MSKPFDASSKYFLKLSPQDWLVLLGQTADLDVSELNSDLSTVTTQADKVFRVNGAMPWIQHIEAQAWHDVRVPIRVCRYGVLLHYEYGLPINSTLILLSPNANGPELTGVYQANSDTGMTFLEYKYCVIRLWEIAPQAFFDAGIGVLAVAPLGKITKEELPELLRQIKIRVESELPKSDWNDYWTGMGVLMELRYEPDFIQQLLKGIINMFDVSQTPTAQKFLKEGRDQGIELGRSEGRTEGLAEGRTEEARQVLIRVITRRFGQVDPNLQTAIESMTDLDLIHKLIDRALDAKSTSELLPTDNS